MSENGSQRTEDRTVVEVIGSHLEHFRNIDPPCRGMALPDGVLLRHTRSASLFFYLRTGVENGKITTHVFASDSPYDRQKAAIGVVLTPMFEARADHQHLKKLEDLIRQWVEFVELEPDIASEFQSFKLDT
jgi:hypothetical protein